MTTTDALFNAGFLPYQFTDAQFLAIGRLIRACAELEEIIDVHMCNVTEVSEGQAALLLGQSSAGRKVKIAELRAKALGKECFDAHKACFNSDHYIKTIRCRNAVAHGQLLGITEDGNIALLTSDITEAHADVVVMKVRAFGHDDFATFASIAEQLIPEFDRLLRTKSLRQTRREPFRARALDLPSPRKPSTKPRRQRQSSPPKSERN